MVSAAFVTHNNQILLFLRDDIPHIKDPNVWDLIGGHSEEGETPEQTLIREMQEEISITPTDYTFLIQVPGNWNETVNLYHVKLTDDQAKNVKIGNEGQKIEFFDIDKIPSLNTGQNLKKWLIEIPDIFAQIAK